MNSYSLIFGLAKSKNNIAENSFAPGHETHNFFNSLILQQQQIQQPTSARSFRWQRTPFGIKDSI